MLAGIGMLSGGSQHAPFNIRTTYVYHMDGNGKQIVHSNEVPVILRFDLQDVIGTGSTQGEAFQVRLEAATEGIFKNRVKGVFLYIDSVGGAVNDSDQIYLALKRFKQKLNVPIYAFVDGICASGAFYIASSADKIFATTVSEIGSVGIILSRPFFNLSQVMEKIGVQSETISAGKDKDAMNPFRPWKPNEAKNINDITNFYYNRFVNIVTSARPKISKQDLINDYGAKIYVAPVAKELGFIDEYNVNYFEAMTSLCQAANVDPEKPYQVVEIIQEKSVFEKLVANSQRAMKSIKLTHEHDIKTDSSSQLDGKPAYILPQR